MILEQTCFRPMRRVGLVGGLALLWGLSLFLALPAGAAEVSLLVRPVEIMRAGQTRWEPLQPRTEVAAGDRLRTGRGARVEISLAPKRVFRLGPASELALPALPSKEQAQRPSRLSLIFGKLWTAIQRTRRPASYEIQLPTATIGIKGTRFGVSFDQPTGQAEVVVIEGQVQARPITSKAQIPKEVQGPREVPGPQEVPFEEWLRVVSSQQKLVLGADGVPRILPVAASDREDPWVAFNLGRDTQLGIE